jgi:uncharacterized cupin superfamily protein
MVAEARLERSAHGLVPTGAGWFVLNARDAVWVEHAGLGVLCAFEGPDGEADFARLGFNLQTLRPGEPMSMYHVEALEQEDFLVLAGEALLIVEGAEWPLRPLDLFHCPPGVAHTIVGMGARPCLVLAVGARGLATGDDWGRYPVDPVALRHGAGVEVETTVPKVAYARFPAGVQTAFHDEFLAGFDASSYRDRAAEATAGGAPGAGWSVVNARDARWRERPGRGAFTTFADFAGRADFSQVSIGLAVAEPGGPIGMYHVEDAQEDFLVLAGAGLAIVEGQERPLRPLDLLHCPPGTRHTIIGAGSGPCLVLVVGTFATAGFTYPVDPVAIRNGVGVEEETSDPAVAYRRFAPTRPVPFRAAFLADL